MESLWPCSEGRVGKSLVDSWMWPGRERVRGAGSFSYGQLGGGGALTEMSKGVRFEMSKEFQRIILSLRCLRNTHLEFSNGVMYRTQSPSINIY